MEISSLKLALVLIMCFISNFVGSGRLHFEEVKVLKDIAKKIGKTDWDFGNDPCSGIRNWRTSNDTKAFVCSNVFCDCKLIANVSTCHITKIELKGQNLSGVIPAEFSKLYNLKHLDLSRNCFTGSLPSQWDTMSLENLIVMGNNLSGSFPTVLTKISTLQTLHIEANNFSGPIPSEIRRLINLKTLILSSNGFSGKLPSALFFIWKTSLV